MNDTPLDGTNGAASTRMSFFDDLSPEIRNLLSQWHIVIGAGLTASLVGLGGAFLIPPTFTARTSFIVPQSQQSPAASALASFGALGALAGAAGGKSNADQFVSLMQSVNIANRLIAQFKLNEVYETKFAIDTYKLLQQNTRVAAGKKDGLITIEVDDHDPARAAGLANAYVSELKTLTDGLALTEAKSRRMFFEQQLKASGEQLASAQARLEGSGISVNLLKTEPKAASEALTRLSTELTSAEVKLEAMRQTLADGATEILRQRAFVAELRGQIRKREISEPSADAAGAGYISIYREFKYQETLYEILSKQLELAKLDEAKEGALIQVIDSATPPERKSKPKRSIFALIFFAAGAAIAALFLWRKQAVHSK